MREPSSASNTTTSTSSIPRSLPHPNGGTPIHRSESVTRALDVFFDAAGRRAAPHGPEYLELWRELRQNTVGGKLLRPKMVFAAYEGAGGTLSSVEGAEDSDPVAWVGAAFELLHTALLVHDDVIDRDFVRRGIPNISGSYRARALAAGMPADVAEHHGLSAAVVAGDLALFYSYRLVDRSGVTGETRRRLLALMDDAMFASAAGELLDLDYSGAIVIPTVESILEMARLKTAVYSFEVPLKAGAVLAGAPDELVASLGEFGTEVGTAYQIADDLLGVFGDTEITGKSTTSDLREGKRTVLVAHAASTSLWADIAPLFGSPDLTEIEAERMREGLVESGARSFAEELLRQHVDRAAAILHRPHVPQAMRDRLEPIIADVVWRAR